MPQGTKITPKNTTIQSDQKTFNLTPAQQKKLNDIEDGIKEANDIAEKKAQDNFNKLISNETSIDELEKKAESLEKYKYEELFPKKEKKSSCGCWAAMWNCFKVKEKEGTPEERESLLRRKIIGQ